MRRFANGVLYSKKKNAPLLKCQLPGWKTDAYGTQKTHRVTEEGKTQIVPPKCQQIIKWRRSPELPKGPKRQVHRGRAVEGRVFSRSAGCQMVAQKPLPLPAPRCLLKTANHKTLGNQIPWSPVSLPLKNYTLLASSQYFFGGMSNLNSNFKLFFPEARHAVFGQCTKFLEESNEKSPGVLGNPLHARVQISSLSGLASTPPAGFGQQDGNQSTAGAPPPGAPQIHTQGKRPASCQPSGRSASVRPTWGCQCGRRPSQAPFFFNPPRGALGCGA